MRIVLVGLPTLLAEAFRRELTVSREQFEVVHSNAIDADDLPIGRGTVGVVVGDDGWRDVSALAPSIWQRSPRCRILTIADDSRSGVIHELRPFATELCPLGFGQAIDLLLAGTTLVDRVRPA